MYDNLDRFELISGYTDSEIDEAYEMLKRKREELDDPNIRLTDILIASLIHTQDDGSESIWTALVEIRDALYDINRTLSYLT